MTTYADLLASTAEQIRIGVSPLRTDRLWSTREAMDAIEDFHAVLDAIASHARRLMWPAQTRRIGLTSHRDGLPANERAATALAAGIETLVGAARPHPSQLAPATTPWLRASLHLRAASDLIAAQFQPDGRPRTPDAAATDARAFDIALVDLGHLAAAMLAAEEPLALRALQTGVRKTAVAKQLPGLGRLADLARDLSSTDGTVDPGARTRLEALSLTWTPIRTGDPVTELGDRMHRLRQTTFDMTTGHGDVIATLRDITTVGIAVHAHTAAFHGAQPTTAPDPGVGAAGAEALILRGRTWQQLHRALAQFVAFAPPSATVRDDLVALRRLLPQLAPLDARTSRAALADVTARSVGASLNGAVATMTSIGDHSATAFAELAESGPLRVNAHDLTRDLVASDVGLTEAKLRSALVASPAALTDAVMGAFESVRAHPIRGLDSTAAPGRGHGQIERETEGSALQTRLSLQRS